MKKILSLTLAIASFAGCGYSSRKNELTGQVKKVAHSTPIFCPDYTSVDVSLGIMRNGVGSMSHEDLWLYVSDKGDEQKLDEAAKSGRPVRVLYDVKRLTWCVEDHFVTSVELLD